MFKIRLGRRAILACIFLLLGCSLVLYNSSPARKNAYPAPPQSYDYYYIFAEEDGRELMRVSVPLNIDDELITEDNKRYKIVQVEGNRGTARFMENVNIEQYRPK